MLKKVFPLLFWTTIFASPIFGSILVVLDMPVQSGMLQEMIIPLAVLSYLLLLANYKYFAYDRSVKKVFAVELLIIVMYLGTSLFYSNPPENAKEYWGTLYYFGSLCVASSIQGCYLAQYNSFEKIEKLIPFFTIPISLIIGTFGLSSYYKYLGVQGVTSALDYQNISYFMSDCYLCSLYYLFFSSISSTRFYKWTRLPVFISMLFSAAICIVAGGRGGFVVLFVISLFVIYILHKTGRMNMWKIIITLGLALFIFSIIASELGVWESSGFQRISETLTQDDNRVDLYKKAWKSVQESILFGHGLGSIWWEVGFYCHNMFLDLLVDLGSIGAFIVLLCMFKIFYKSLQLSKRNYVYVLIMFLMLKALINTSFSGYWLNTQLFWLVLGFVTTRTNKLF